MHRTFFYLYKIREGQQELELIHTLELTSGQLFGSKCHGSRNKNWVSHQESIFYFAYANQKYTLHELNLKTEKRSEHTSFKRAVGGDVGDINDIQFSVFSNHSNEMSREDFLSSTCFAVIASTTQKQSSQSVFVNNLD